MFSLDRFYLLVALTAFLPSTLASPAPNPVTVSYVSTTTVTVTATGSPAAAPSSAAAGGVSFAPQGKVGQGKAVAASPTPGSDTNAPQASAAAAGSYINAAYFINWGIYARGFHPDQIPAEELNRVYYAFLIVQADGTVVSNDDYADVSKHYPGDSWNDSGDNIYGAPKQLFLLKKKNRHVKTLLSIGGWNNRAVFSAATSTDATRARLASTAVTFLQDWGFDGIDIDWEYPADDTEAANLVLLLKAIRQELDKYAAAHAPNYKFLLTVASPAGPAHYNVMHLKEMDALIDSWNMMAYDYSGSTFSTKTGHASNLYPSTSDPASTDFNTDQAVKDYISKGIPANKIVLGIPAYGHAFDSTSGMGQTFSAPQEGSWVSGDDGKGIWDYKALPRAGATPQFDNETQASYSYDASTKELISYDDVDSVKIKADYAIKNGLGGAFFWTVDADRNDTGSLISTTFNEFKTLESSENLLSYPASKYANMAAGMPNE